MSAPTPNLTPDNIDYAHTSNVARLHAAAAREKSEPIAKSTPLTLGIVLGICCLTFFAGGYFWSNMGSFENFGVANIKGYGLPPVIPPGTTEAPPPSEEKLHEPDAWIAQGRAEFSVACSSCHQLSGEGVPGQFPPLKGSEFVLKGERRLVAILRHGIIGALTVNGKGFNGTMEPLGTTKLSPRQLAQILSYVRNDWGNKASILYEDQITALSKELGNRPSYSEGDLRAINEAANAPASTWPEKLKGAGAAPATPGAAPATPGAAPGAPAAPGGTTPAPSPGSPAPAPK